MGFSYGFLKVLYCFLKGESLKFLGKVFSILTIMDQFISKGKNMKALNQEAHEIPRLQSSRRSCRKRKGNLSWVHEHLQLTQLYSFNRVPLPEKGKRVGRRGRKATGQSWALIAGLPKEQSLKGQRKCQDFRAY